MSELKPRPQRDDRNAYSQVRPAPVEPGWLSAVRLYIAVPSPDTLANALNAAHSEPEVQALLGDMPPKDPDVFHARTLEVGARLASDGDRDAARTLELLALFGLAQLAVGTESAPSKQQPGALQRGLDAAQEGAELARWLGDPASTARFITLRAAGLRNSGDLQAARAAYAEGLALYRNLAIDQPQMYRAQLARAFCNLGAVLADLHRPEAACVAYEEALALYRDLAVAHPELHRADLASTLSSLGVALAEAGDRDGALEAAREEVTVYRGLATARPDAFLPDLAMSLTNLGRRQAALGEWNQAIVASRKAVGLYRSLGSSQSDHIQPFLAVSLEALGLYLLEVNRLSEAASVAEEALELYRELAVGVLQSETEAVASALGRVGLLCLWAGREEAAQKAEGEARELMRPLDEARVAGHPNGKAARLTEIWDETTHSATPEPARSRRVWAERELFQLPFPIDALRAENLRSVHKLALEFRGAAIQGQWICFLGENGAGKSSLLRGLCLALTRTEVANALVGDEGGGAPLVRRGAEKAVLHAVGPWSTPPMTLLRSDTLESVAENRKPFPAPFVAAYGAHRGSAAEGEANQIYENLRSPVRAIATLFDGTSPLVNVGVWLELQMGLAAHTGTDSEQYAFVEAVKKTVAGLLPGGDAVNEVHIELGQGVFLSGPQIGERTPLAGLSDGYLATLGWTLDLIARWADAAHRHGVVPNGNFAHRMTGVVLVDDLDLHLHPRWQYTLIADLRKTFPLLTFVVTTHSPLTILGLQPGELFVVSRNDAGDTQVRPADLPDAATDTDVRLTGQWFGLPSGLDPTTVGMMERFQQALLKEPDAPETRRLHASLQRRLEPTSLDSGMILPPMRPHRSTPASRSAVLQHVNRALEDRQPVGTEQPE